MPFSLLMILVTKNLFLSLKIFKDKQLSHYLIKNSISQSWDMSFPTSKCLHALSIIKTCPAPKRKHSRQFAFLNAYYHIFTRLFESSTSFFFFFIKKIETVFIFSFHRKSALDFRANSSSFAVLA